jgi:hypothetical protein
MAAGVRALVAVALLAAAPVPAQIANVVEPCPGAGAGDLMRYCCKEEGHVPLLLLPDAAITGYVTTFVSQTQSILGAHGVRVGVTYGGDGGLWAREAENMPELCQQILYALAGSLEDLKFKLPVVFVTSGGELGGAHNAGRYIADLQQSCEGPIREWFSDDEEERDWLLTNLNPYQVVVVNTHDVPDRICWETLAHEVGHGFGLVDDGDPGNVMYGCTPGTLRTGLTHHQVAKLCRSARFNSLPHLP